MSRQLLFVHGRAQEHKDADSLKFAWTSALRRGLAKSNLELPISEEDIKFPYYGQTLYDLTAGSDHEEIAKVVVRGENKDDAQREFLQSVLLGVLNEFKITDAQLADAYGSAIVDRGPLNWEWLQGILKAIDKYVPGGSGASVAIATNDVYQYLKKPGVRDMIDDGVRSAISPAAPTVVVSHSLGTVVAYNVLNREGSAQKWVIPLHITLGSPLAVAAIKSALEPISHPSCVETWFNAMDERDVVALYPLDGVNFHVNPTIENKTDVQNETSNRHGISGYLEDQDVARRIYDALVAE